MVVEDLIEAGGGHVSPVVVEGPVVVVGLVEAEGGDEGLVETEGGREDPKVVEGLVVVAEGLVEGLAARQRATTATVPSCPQARSAGPCGSTVTNQEGQHPPPTIAPVAVSSLAGASPTSVSGSCGPHGHQTLNQCGSRKPKRAPKEL